MGVLKHKFLGFILSLLISETDVRPSEGGVMWQVWFGLAIY